MTRKLLFLSLVLSPLAFGQGMQTYSTTVAHEILTLVTSGQPVFMAFGTKLLTSLGVIMLVIYGLKWALASASNYHGHFDFPGMVHFFCLFIMAEMMLRFYNTPLPWVGSSFSQLLPDTGQTFANSISMSALTTLIGQIGNIVSNMKPPGVLSGLDIVVYCFILLDMTVISGVLFAITIIGFVAIGIGALVGPIFIPWLVVPRMAWLFWNWLSYMLQYSFYPVIAAALVFVWSNVLVTFVTHTIHGDYTIAHWIKLLVPLGLLNIGMFVSMFRIHSFISDLFRGGAAAGAALSGNLLGIAKGLFQ